MESMEPFTMLDYSPKRFHLFDTVLDCESAKSADHDLQYVAALRKQFPDKVVTAVPQVSANIIGYANAGHASIELDTSTEDYSSWKGYVQPARRSEKGGLGEATQFAKYHVRWKESDFVVYLVQIGFSAAQYVLTKRRDGEDTHGPSLLTDALIVAAGEWGSSDNEVVWVYDLYWRKDKQLYRDVKKASWDKVILNEGMKKDLTSVANTFFSSKKIYEELGVPWKRGLLFHGPPGNGKTISVKALMHTLLFERKADPIPTLYVKAAPYTWCIGQIFDLARSLSPCMVVLEDVETIVTPQTRSYFFNEMDGLASNDGIFVVASTNYLDRLDPGLTKRPSRFDRKYLFPLPNEHERTLYCQFWQKKLESNPKIDFPNKLCPAMAKITENFSFAFLQECFVATMLSLARSDDDVEANILEDEGHDDLDQYEIWRAFKAQADILRKQIRDYEDYTHDAGAITTAATSAGVGDAGRHPQRRTRGFDAQTGQQVYLDAGAPQSSSGVRALAFNNRKQPELNTSVWQWVAPRGFVAQ